MQSFFKVVVGYRAPNVTRLRFFLSFVILRELRRWLFSLALRGFGVAWKYRSVALRLGAWHDSAPKRGTGSPKSCTVPAMTRHRRPGCVDLASYIDGTLSSLRSTISGCWCARMRVCMCVCTLVRGRSSVTNNCTHLRSHDCVTPF